MDHYRGKVCIVTGAGAGIGKALSEALLRRGSVVYAWDVNQIALKAFAAEARKLGWELTTDVVDVTDPAQVRAARDRICADRRRVDFWFNNAGVASIRGFMEAGDEDFRRVVSVNLGGVVDGTRAALEIMEKQGAGTVINIASVAGFIA